MSKKKNALPVVVVLVCAALVLWFGTTVPLPPWRVVDANSPAWRWFQRPWQWTITSIVRAASTWYVSCPSTGVADCTTSGSACDFQTLWGTMGGGTHPDDQINVVGTSMAGSGHYNLTSCMFNPPAGLDGTVGHPIVVQTVDQPSLVHVYLDGTGSQTVIASFSGHQNWKMNGIAACCLGAATSGAFTVNNGAANIEIDNSGCWDMNIGYNAQCYQFANSLLSAGPQPALGPVVVDTFFEFGKGRKGSSLYATGSPNPAVTMRHGVFVWDGSTNVGPKLGTSKSYHSKGSIDVDNTYIWAGRAMPNGYLIQNDGGPYGGAGDGWGSGYQTSTSSLSIGTGSKTWAITGSCAMTAGSNPLAHWLRSSKGNTGTFMEGNVTSCTNSVSMTVNVTTTGGAGGPFTDWALDKKYTDNTVEQSNGILGVDGNDLTHDVNSDTHTRIYGGIVLIRNADAPAGAQGVFMTQFTDQVVQDTVVALDSNFTTKTSFTLANCTSGPPYCQTPANNFATNITTVGNGFTPSTSQLNIQGQWTQSNVVRIAKSSYVWGGSGTNKDNICNLHNDDGSVKSGVPRYPFPLAAAFATAQGIAGYTAIVEQTEVANLLGTAPAACDATLQTPTPTFTGTLTSTFTNTATKTPTNTATPTATYTPSVTPVGTPCSGTHVHTDQMPPEKVTHSGPCDASGKALAPHTHLKTPTPGSTN